MAKMPNWTPEELNYLQDKWGAISIKGISINLGKSVNAVRLKAQRIGLTDARMYFDGITVNQLAKALGREYSIILNWINRYGLPARKKLFCQESRVLVVEYESFWKWSEEHKELINFTKMEWGMLGAEPEWVKTKRKAAQLRSQRTWQSVNWTPAEDQRLEQLLRMDITYPELANLLNRSEATIKRRIHELNLKLRPTRLNNHIKYTNDEVKKLLQMAEQGYSYESIAQVIGKSALGVRGKLERMGFDFKRRRLKETAR